MECMLCPRRCGVDRSVTKGFCHMGDKIKVAKTMLHMWEEPSISVKLPEKSDITHTEAEKLRKKQQFDTDGAENACSAAERVENTRQSVDKTQNVRGSVNKTENTRRSVDNSENRRGSVDKTENMQGCTEKTEGQGGSGAIFFSGCSLGCVYCQNRDIRSGDIGKEISVQELADEMLALQD
ncbi:MAG: 4Fe-4S cluster-binding domain-containing protein, partial [Eubacteriales bacterium]